MVDYVNLISQTNNNWIEFKEYIIENKNESIS